jgi:Fe-S cluster assembly iron-binding protein IscA
MVHVTDQALDRLEALRDQNELPPEEGLALVRRETGDFAFAAVTPQPEDQVIERDGKPVMIVPAVFATSLDRLLIDYVDTPEMQGFTLSEQE